MTALTHSLIGSQPASLGVARKYAELDNISYQAVR